MLEERIKEELSNHFAGILANYGGFVLEKPKADYGVDFVLKKLCMRVIKGKREFTFYPFCIDIQMKSTTEKSVKEKQNTIGYKLRAKNYNDLIDRVNTQMPLVLLLFILPDDKLQWVECQLNGVLLRKHCYWFRLTETEPYVTSDKWLEIPKSNRLSNNSFNELFNKFHNV